MVEENEKDGIHLEKDGWEFHWDGGRKGHLSFAVLVLAVGVQLLIAKLLAVDINFWQILWPSSLIVFGLGGLFGSFSFIKVSSLLLGGWFLADYWAVLPIQFGSGLVFPALVIVFGLSLLFDALKKPNKPRFEFHHNGTHKCNDFHVDGDRFEYASSFGESTQLIRMTKLRSGQISCSFGDYVVDLSGVEAVTDNCTLDISCSFGDLELRVPRCYAVRQTNSTAFASFDISGHPDPDPRGVITVNFIKIFHLFFTFSVENLFDSR